MRTRSFLASLMTLVLLAGCSNGQVETLGTPAPESRGLAFAESRCAACHGVRSGQSSTNVEAPPFESVANMPDLTDRTLASWLRNSHNFPDTMDFTIADSQIDDLSFYILSLRKSRYSPPIQ